MTKKLRCNVTGNLFYVTPKRYARILAKYGDEQTLNSTYVSMLGKKIIEGREELPKEINNRIRCSITGKIVYITNQRMEAGIKKYGSEEELRTNYKCREAARFLREGKTIEEIKNEKGANR